MNIIFHESRFETQIVSPKGASGLMQLMPSVLEQYSVSDPFDPKMNIDTGTRLFARLLAEYRGDIVLALAAYNAGPGRVDLHRGVPDIRETQAYVATIAGKACRSGHRNEPLSTDGNHRAPPESDH